MRLWKVSILCLGFSFASTFSFAQNPANNEIPLGSEIIKVGGNQLIVPKGSIIQRDGAHITIEDPGQYMARQFVALEDRLKKIEGNYQALQREMDTLKTNVKKMQQQDLVGTKELQRKSDVKLLRVMAGILQQSDPDLATGLQGYADKVERDITVSQQREVLVNAEEGTVKKVDSQE